MSKPLKIALLGAGQLGGSFALAVHSKDVSIAAYDIDPAQPKELLDRQGIDRVAATVEEAVRGADLVMLAAPLRSYRDLATAIAPHLASHAIVTDLGSVKRSADALAGILPGARLVPGHPIAGGERSGAAVARDDLFRGKLCILTPNTHTDAAAVATVEKLWALAGAELLRMPTEVHDTIYAQVSHLPHFIAFIAAETLYLDGACVKPEQETLQRFLRISRSNARMWTDVALENREALLPALAIYIALLEHFTSELKSGEGAASDADHVAAIERFFPRILASSLISGVSLYERQSGLDLRPFGAGGMRDIVAPAASDPQGELEAMSKSAPAVAALLARAIPLFRMLESQIGAEDEAGLFAFLSLMSEHAHALVTPRQ